MKRYFAGICILLSCNVSAHRVNIFAYAENGRVYTESYYSDGSPAVNSRIEVFDNKTGKLLLSGSSDAGGRFSFGLPQKAAMRIVLNASMGHRNECVLMEEELTEAHKTGGRDLDGKKRPAIGGRRRPAGPAAAGVLAGIACIFVLAGMLMYIKRVKKRSGHAS